MTEKPVGRPTDYKPEYCALVVERMGNGLSAAGFAGEIGVSRSSIYKWAETIPEFSDALNQARAASAKFWEDRAIDLALGGKGNPAVVIFALKNRVADEWREVIRNEHSGPDGGPIKSEDVTRDADDFARRMAVLAARSLGGTGPAGPHNEGST